MPIGTPTLLLASSNGGSGFTSGSASSAITANAPIGSLIVVWAVNWNNTDQLVASVSDSGGNAYSQAAQPAATASVFSGGLFYSSNTTHALTSGTSTFTVTVTTGQQYGIIAAVISGANGGQDTAITQTSANAAGSGITLSTGTLSTANEIILGGANLSSNKTFGATGFTEVDAGSLGSLGMTLCYQIVSSTASVTLTPVYTGSVAEASVLVGFEQSATTTPDVQFFVDEPELYVQRTLMIPYQ